MDSGLIITAPSDLSLAQQQMVRDTLRTILDSPYFCKSKRYPALLEYLVLKTLEGSAVTLKERSVGIDVFGRPHTYDPGNDPLVRVAAGEVRKRLELYFSKHPDAPVRIELPLGHYAAEFHFRRAAISDSIPEQPPLDVVAPLEAVLVEEPTRLAADRPRRLVWAGILAAILLLIATVAYWRYTQNPARLSFWSPVLRNDLPAVVVFGERSEASDQQNWSPALANSGAAGASTSGGTSVENAMTAGQICNIFRQYARTCEMVSASRANLPYLQNKTVVLIGLDNDWTHRVLVPLRFRFQADTAVPPAPKTEFIVDQSSSANHITWKLGPQHDVDYAFVGRFHSDITDGMAVVEAGLTPNGTLGAAQFVSSPEDMKQLLTQAPKDWKGFNFEAVLQINVLQGAPGHVNIVATHFW